MAIIYQDLDGTSSLAFLVAIKKIDTLHLKYHVEDVTTIWI